MELTRPKAILFDWDNTLVSSWPVIHKALEDCFVEMGRTPWTMEEVQAKVQHSAKDAFQGLFKEDWQHAVSIYQAAYRKHHNGLLKPFPQAEESLKHIADANLYCAVVSNKTGATLREESTHMGWDVYFRAIIGAGDAQADKPHPSHAELALQHHQDRQDTTAIWFIGDSAVDMEIAQNCGFTPIFYGTAEKAKTIPYPISAQISSHSELIELLLS